MPRSPSPPRSRSRTPLSRSPSPGPPEQDDACPFLIRMYVTKGRHTPLRDFDDGKLPSQDEYHVYGWKDSTPTSLVQQLYAVLPAPYRSPVARYNFKHVYVDASPAGLYKAKEIISFSGRDFVATVAPGVGGTGAGAATANGDGDAMDRALGDDVHDTHARRGNAITDEETLDDIGFLKGDLLSVAVDVPAPRGAGGAGGRAQGSNAPRRPSGVDGQRNGISGPRDSYVPPRRDVRDPPPHRDREREWGRARGPPPPRSGGVWRDRDRPERDRGWGRRSPDLTRRSRSPDDRRGSWSRGRN